MEGIFTNYFCNITGIVFQSLPSAINLEQILEHLADLSLSTCHYHVHNKAPAVHVRPQGGKGWTQLVQSEARQNSQLWVSDLSFKVYVAENSL